MEVKGEKLYMTSQNLYILIKGGIIILQEHVIDCL